MELRHLRHFIAIAESGSFRRAAEKLNLSQPPLSVSLRQLEEIVGAVLVDRSRQHVRLTTAGETFLVKARHILAETAVAVESTRRAAAGKLGSLSLSFVPSASFGVVPQLLRRFSAEYPDVKLTLSGETTSHQVAALSEARCDVGILVPPLQGRHELIVERIATEELVLAVPESHRLATRSVVELADIATEPFIGFPFDEGPGFGAAVLAACRECDFVPNFVQIAPQIHTILVLVAGNIGISLVPNALRSVMIENVRYVPVGHRGGKVSYSVALAYDAKNINPAVGAFVELARRGGTTVRTKDP